MEERKRIVYPLPLAAFTATSEGQEEDFGYRTPSTKRDVEMEEISQKLKTRVRKKTMGLLEDLKGWMSEVGISAIQAERLALFEDRLEAVERENAELSEEVSRLEKENRELARQMQEKTVPQDFVEEQGVFLRRDPAGRLGPTAYCLRCKLPMSSLGGMLPFQCSGCRYIAPITGDDLHGILQKINA